MHRLGHVTHQLARFCETDPPDLRQLIRAGADDTGLARHLGRHVHDPDASHWVNPAADDTGSTDSEFRLLKRLPDRGVLWSSLPLAGRTGHDGAMPVRRLMARRSSPASRRAAPGGPSAARLAVVRPGHLAEPVEQLAQRVPDDDRLAGRL